MGQHQAGNAATGTEVEAVHVVGQFPGDGEAAGVVDVETDRAGSEEPERSRPLEKGVERAQSPSGRITTRRRGSSPSDAVTTPSMVFTVSCTTLRSAGDMGSSTRRMPVSCTRVTCWRVKASRAKRR